jgi:hypothetical protein
MALDKRWASVPPRNFTADGSVSGQVTLASVDGFYLGQTVIIKSNTKPAISLQVVGVISPSNVVLGPLLVENQVSDLSTYLVSDNATIAANDQIRPTIPWQTYTRSVYEELPINAIRTYLINGVSGPVTKDNPLPVAVAGSNISLNGDVYVKLTDKMNTPTQGDVADAVQIGDGNYRLKINPDGSIPTTQENPQGAQTTVNKYNEVSIVPDIQTDVVSYTVPANKTSIIERVTGSGQNLARFDLFVNASVIDTQRNYYGNFNVAFNFMSSGMGYKLNAGDVVTLKVTQSQSDPYLFSGRLQVTESI